MGGKVGRSAGRERGVQRAKSPVGGEWTGECWKES